MTTATITPPKKRNARRPNRECHQLAELPPVDLWYKYGTLYVTPLCAQLERLLNAERWTTDPEKKEVVLELRREPLYEDLARRFGRDSMDSYMVPLGLGEYVRYISWQLRGEVPELEEGTPIWRLPPPRGEIDAGSLPPNPAVLDLLHGHAMGLIRYAPKRCKPEEFLLQIARAWPDSPMVVTGQNKQRLERVANYLNDHKLNVREASRWGKQKDARILVGTPAEIFQCYVRRYDYRLLFFLDVEAASWLTKGSGKHRGIDPDMLCCLFPSARYYGFLPIHAEATRYEWALGRTIFGFREAWVPEHGMSPVEIEVVSEKISGGPPLSQVQDLLELKQRGVWRHPVRNRRIVKLARQLVAADRGPLTAEFPKVAAAVGEASGQRVAILVENVEHALQLKQRLRDWPIIAGGSLYTAGLSHQQQLWLENDRQLVPRQLPRAIVTERGLPKLGRIDVLVRADAGLGLPPLSRPQKCGPAENPGKLVLIDFYDNYHPELRRWSKHRWDAYFEARWRRLHENPAVDEIERFYRGIY